MNRAIFMDRDGVINKRRPFFPNDGEGDIRNYVTKWDDWEWCDGALEAFELLAGTDYFVLVVSNQSCIGRGLVLYPTIQQIFWRMREEIKATGVWRDRVGYSFCRHAPGEKCACRKPKPGMIYSQATNFSINLSQSWMVGDSPSDIEAGYRAGIPINHLIPVDEEVMPFTWFQPEPLNNKPPPPEFWNIGIDYKYTQPAEFQVKPRHNLLEAVHCILHTSCATT